MATPEPVHEENECMGNCIDCNQHGITGHAYVCSDGLKAYTIYSHCDEFNECFDANMWLSAITKLKELVETRVKSNLIQQL